MQNKLNLKKNVVIIAAGGLGQRMKKPKQFLLLGKKPMLAHTLLAFEKCPLIDEIILVIRKQDLKKAKTLAKKEKITKLKKFAEAGKERAYSILNGLAQVDNQSNLVAIHDGARPFIDQKTIIASLKAAEKFGAACVGVPVKDTIKKVDANENISVTVERKTLWQAQTPQVFKKEIICQAYKNQSLKRKTDDCSLAEACGFLIKMVMGSYTNIKITIPEDLILGQAILDDKFSL